MFTFLKSLFTTDEAASARPTATRAVLGAESFGLEAREVPSITPAQIAAVQVQSSATVAALAAVPVNQANANAAVQDARTALTAISGSGNPVDVQNRAAINARVTVLSVEKAEYDAARSVLQSVLAAYGVANAAQQSSFPYMLPDNTLAQQRTTVSTLTARLTAEAAELKAATGLLRTAAGVYGGTPADANSPLAVRVAMQVERANLDLIRGGTAWQMADQMVAVGVIRYRQILTQVSQLEMQRLALLSNPFAAGQGAVLQSTIYTLRQQADRLGTNMVLAHQAMARHYETWYSLQAAVERAKATRTTATVAEMTRQEVDLVTLRAKLAADASVLRASVATVSS